MQMQKKAEVYFQLIRSPAIKGSGWSALAGLHRKRPGAHCAGWWLGFECGLIGKEFDSQTVQTVTSYILTTPSRPLNGSLPSTIFLHCIQTNLKAFIFHYYIACLLKIKKNSVSQYQWPNHYISVLTHILVFSYILFWQNMLCNCQAVLTNCSRQGRPVPNK
jgi:hypothetical protein